MDNPVILWGHDPSVADNVLGEAISLINIHGSRNVNAAQNSSHVNQCNTLTQEQLRNINDAVDSYRTMVEHLQLPEEKRLEAETIVARIEAEAGEANAQTGKIRQGLERLGGIVSEHGAKGFATALFGLIEQAIQNLGQHKRSASGIPKEPPHTMGWLFLVLRGRRMCDWLEGSQGTGPAEPRLIAGSGHVQSTGVQLS